MSSEVIESKPHGSLPYRNQPWSSPDSETAHGSRLHASLVKGQSSATVCSCMAPMRILIPKPVGTSVWSYLSTYGGGAVSGDRTDLLVTIDPGAKLFLGTQSSNKIYRADDRGRAEHRMVTRVAPNGLMVFVPDVLQPFQDSEYFQSQQFWLRSGSGLVVLDWVCSGRQARSEQWQLRSLELRNQIWLEDRCVMNDALRLCSLADSTLLAQRFRGFDVVGTLIAAGQLLGKVVEHWQSSLTPDRNRRPFKLHSNELHPWYALCPLKDGLIIRFAAQSWETAWRWIQSLLLPLEPALGGVPWFRKC